MKRKLAVVAVILALVTVLVGCTDVADSLMNVAVGDKTEAESRPKDLYPAVPDELESNYFLCSKNMGRCKSLVGKIHVLLVLIEDGESIWDTEAVSELKETVPEVLDVFMSYAEDYSAELTMTASYAKIEGNEPLQWDEDKKWRDMAVKAAGYDSMDKADALICEEYDTDGAVILFCFNKKGRSYAETAVDKDGIEYAVIYDHDVETYMHEMTHLFGTMDYYYPEDIKAVAEKYFSGTIMASGTEPVFDDLSAFVVGWTDELSDDALSFLKETSAYTSEDAESAGEKETVTGKVENRPIRGYVDGEVVEIGLYTGDMVDGTATGEGRIQYHNGDHCEGSFSYGALNGEGEYVWANGDRRKGTWVNGVLEGYGVDERADGARYEGEFKENKYHGEGTYVNADGNEYTGEWVNGKFHGYGKYTWNEGGVYEGEFADGSLTGYGVYTNPNGEVFEGYFEDWKYVG